MPTNTVFKSEGFSFFLSFSVKHLTSAVNHHNSKLQLSNQVSKSTKLKKLAARFPMDSSIVPLICFIGGNFSSTNSSEYVGGRSSASFISKSTTISELCEQAKATCGVVYDSLIKIKCRYPLNQSMAIALDICDESSLAVAMASIPSLSSSLVVYVEEVAMKQGFAPMGPSTIEGIDKHDTVEGVDKHHTVEGIDKHATIASPSESCVTRTPSKVRRGKDIGWLHCTPIGEGTNKTQCNYCGKVMSGGGITRMKQHLAGGNDVEKCTKCGLEVRQMFRDLIRKKKMSKSNRRMKELRYAEFSMPDCFEDEEAAKEDASPVIQSQLSAGASCGRAHEEIAFMNKDSDDE